MGITDIHKWVTSWENLFMPYANNKGADQPAHPRSLTSAFVVRCIDSIIPLVSILEMSNLYLASVAEQAGLSQPWSQTPKTGFLVSRLKQTWGQLLWNVIHYITITLKLVALYYSYNYPVFENVMNYITITSSK